MQGSLLGWVEIVASTQAASSDRRGRQFNRLFDQLDNATLNQSRKRAARHFELAQIFYREPATGFRKCMDHDLLVGV